MRNVPVLSIDKGRCCGCGVCAELCANNAITMKRDEEGFLYPVINEEKCIACNLCLKVCSFKKDIKEISCNEKILGIYAARIRDNKRVKKSASGGMFTALSDYYLENGGAVVASVYNYETHQMEFALIQDKNIRDKALGSIYIQSNPDKIYKKLVEWLSDNPTGELMFIGTGCQCASLKEYAGIKKVENRILLVDIICQGVASPQVWKSYIESVEQKANKKISFITFKDKRFGWRSPLALYKIGEKMVQMPEVVKLINSKHVFRPSCYHCPYTKLDRVSDLTIGDYWGIEKTNPDFYSKAGNSLVIIQSPKGLRIFNNVSNRIEYIESDRNSCMQPSLQNPVVAPKDRDEFWNLYHKNGIESVLRKYGHMSLNSKIKSKLKFILGSIGIMGK